MAVEKVEPAVGRLVAHIAVDREIERPYAHMRPEEVPLHRSFQPIAELRLHGHEFEGIVTRNSIRAENERYIYGIMFTETVLHADIGYSGDQISYIRLLHSSLSPIRDFYLQYSLLQFHTSL